MVFGCHLHVFGKESVWGQAEPAVPGRPAALKHRPKHSLKQVMPASLSCGCHVQAAFVVNNR